MLFCRRYLPLGTAMVAALMVWLVFSPGNMSYDSFIQYRQSFTYDYHNWHPPIMAIILSIVMFYGGGVGTLTLMQCLAGVLGIRALAMMIFEQLSRGRWTPERTCWLGTLVALLLLLPVTPAAFYLMTFWKDSWTAILFLWVGAFGLRLYTRCERLPRGTFLLQFAALTALMILTGITRHNSLVAMPVMGGMLWLILARRKIRFGWLLIGVPMAASICMSAALDRIYSVERYNPENHVEILELVGFCIAYPECREEFPYISQNMLPGGEQSYRFGNIFSLTDPRAPAVNMNILNFTDKAALSAEYRHAVFSHPMKLLHVKWWAFCQLFNPAYISGSYFQKGLDANPYGLHQNDRFARVRKRLALALDSSLQAPLLSWIAYHNVWFSLNFAAAAGLLIHFCRKRTAPVAFRLCVIAVPLSYALSYFAAVTGMDYRFLYPSTLFMQVAALSCAIFYGLRYFTEEKGVRTN
jgi:hypothetical protein